MSKSTRFATTTVAVVTACLGGLCLNVSVLSQDVALELREVWDLEQAYWRYTKAGDIDRYLTLWHADFVGWSCGSLQPGRKAGVGRVVRDVLERRRTVTYEIHPLASERFGDVVIVHYAADVASEYPDGQRQNERQKITHTWLKGADGWRIIGGMCAPLEQQRQ